MDWIHELRPETCELIRHVALLTCSEEVLAWRVGSLVQVCPNAEILTVVEPAGGGQPSVEGVSLIEYYFGRDSGSMPPPPELDPAQLMPLLTA
jgi:hypothetical protein